MSDEPLYDRAQHPEQFADIEITDGDIRVQLTWAGEGLNGEWDDTDHDRPLIRFYVVRLVDGGWEDVDDASYCTQIDVRSRRGQLEAFARTILTQVAGPLRAGEPVGSLCAELSWTELPGR